MIARLSSYHQDSRPDTYFTLADARHFTFIFFFLFGLIIPARSQSSQVTELVKLYDQAIKNKDHKKSAQYAYELAGLYKEAKDLDNTLDYLDQSLTYAKKAGDASMLYTVFDQLGACNTEVKKYTKAVEHYQEALTIARKRKEGSKIKEQLINIAAGYGSQERYKRSIEYAEEALSIAIVEKDPALQQKCYQLLAGYYEKQGNHKKAAEYYTQYSALVTAKHNEELKKREVNELKQRIEKEGLEKRSTQSKLSEQTKKLGMVNDSLRKIEGSLRVTSDSLKVIEEISRNRQMEIDLLQKDKELADTRIREQEVKLENEALVRNFVAMGILLSLALIAVLIISYRKKSNDNKKIAQQNKNIRSSINYAKRIQEAMLPKTEQHPGIFENAFVLFKPRDTVSGDFYWFSDIKITSQHADIAFAAVDCTGHGVPGAFMSMIGINALNGIINRGITETNAMLDALDLEIRTALKQEVSGNNDGMDVALCIYRPGRKTLEFSGAKNPLVYIQNQELHQIKGDIHSIGGSKHKKQFSFRKHEITIDKPTVIYLFSDGYKDQFGGKDNMKFMSKRLSQLLLDIHHKPMQEQMGILQNTIDAWKGANQQTDDILVMGLKLEPS